MLADDRVRYKGEPIAVVVVAETEAAAVEAAAKVRLDLEELPAVFDVEEALEPGAPIVTHWGTNYFVYEGHHCRRVRHGDAEAAREQADHVIIGPLPDEPDRARPGRDRRAASPSPRPTAGSPSTRTPRRSTSASTTRRSSSRSHRTGCASSAAASGGGFGGKVDVIVEPLATLAAMRTGRPVSYVYTRDRGDAGLLDPERPGLHPRRRDGRRHDRLARGDDLRGRRRLQPPHARTGARSTRPTPPGRTRSPTSRSTCTASTRTGRRRARCAASG